MFDKVKSWLLGERGDDRKVVPIPVTGVYYEPEVVHHLFYPNVIDDKWFHYDLLRDVEQWLKENVPDGEWTIIPDQDYINHPALYFKRDVDAIMFKLHWLDK